MRRSNLPAEPNRFVGRAAEQAELARLLEDSRLVTVVGVGGVGKTRLALRVASGAQKRYGDGVRLAELAPLRDPDLVEHALVEALGLTDHTLRGPREVLAEHLAERRLLLVLDGFEHLVESCAPLVRELLAHAPGLTVLAVGRRPLRVAGEAVFRLAPMGEADAVALLAERAAEAGAPVVPVDDPSVHGRPVHDFSVRDLPLRDSVHRSAHEATVPAAAHDSPASAAVRELCRRLDGIPLALELAAGRLPLLSVEQMLCRLDDRFRLLTVGARGALPRHQTLRTAIGWSHELCTPEERLLWARLSVFAGPFDLEAVEYVCGGPELPPDRILDLLGGLLAQSLVAREDTPAGPGYRILDTVAAYGAEWLAALGDTERLRRRHRDWYMGLATWCELEWFSPRQAEVAARTDAAPAEPPGGPRPVSRTTGGRASRAAPGGHALVRLGGLRASLGGPALAGAGARAGVRARGGPAQGAVGARVRDDPPGRRHRRGGRAPRVPGAGQGLQERAGGGVRDAPDGLSGAALGRHAAGGGADRAGPGVVPRTRRAEQQRADGAGRAGDGAGVRRRSGGCGRDLPGGAGGLRGARGALDQGVRALRARVLRVDPGRFRGGAGAARRVRDDQPHLP